jgi:hypothetical protein
MIFALNAKTGEFLWERWSGVDHKITSVCCGWDAGMRLPVKGFRTPARHRRERAYGGRRPKSLSGGKRGELSPAVV